MDEENPLIKNGQACQVIGGCRGGVKPTEAEWQRVLNLPQVLDSFADEERFDPDFLPWPLEETGDAQPPE